MTASQDGAPQGDAYAWVRRATALLESGDAAAAAVLLERADLAHPGRASVLEALGRALYQSGEHARAVEVFARLVAMTPDDDYARFGLGVALARTGRFAEAVEHLALAAAMRPDRSEYAQHLRAARATLRAREDVGRG